MKSVDGFSVAGPYRESTLAVLVVLALALPAGAHAGFVVDAATPKVESKAEAPKKAAPRVVYLGDAVKFDVARGMGRQVTLQESIVQVVPPGWEVSFEELDRELKFRVTWRGGVEWTQVLTDILAQTGAAAVINTSERTVVIRRYVKDPSAVAPRVSPPTAAPAPEVAQAPKALVWSILSSDKTLRSALSRWAGSVGWHLAWEVDIDYPVTFEGQISGTFEEAVSTVMSGLSGAQKPLQAMFYETNRVVRIVPYAGR